MRIRVKQLSFERPVDPNRRRRLWRSRQPVREALGASSIGGRELRGLPVEVYLFGSRADGTARMSSDLDIGVLPTGPLLADALARLREAFDESTIPYEVDLVDLSRVAPRFASASCERVGSGSPE